MAISAVIAGAQQVGKAAGINLSLGGLIDTLGIGKGSGAKRRNAIRKQLQTAGFNLVNTPSKQFGGWNIDDWNDAALQNAVAAYNRYGQIVADLHNEMKLSNEMAQNQQTLFRYIESQLQVKEATGQVATQAAQSGQVQKYLTAAAALGVIGYLIYQK